MSSTPSHLGRPIIATDIETTGLTMTSKATVIGFGTWMPTTGNRRYSIHALAPGQSAANDSQQADSQETLVNGQALADSYATSKTTISVDYHDTEYDLITGAIEALDSLAEELTTNQPTVPTDSPLLVGYNSSNFDVPFLRTRTARHGTDWELTRLEHLDLQKLFQYKFNRNVATVDGLKKKHKREFGEEIGAPVDDDMYSDELTDAIESFGYQTDDLAEYTEEHDIDLLTSSESSLDGLHKMLCGDPLLDPLDDSKEGVAAYENADYMALLGHNLVDLSRTLDLTKAGITRVSPNELPIREL